VLPQIAADALGLPVDWVSCDVPDTALVPDSGPTVASRTTMILGSVMERCAESLKKRFFEFVSQSKNICTDHLRIFGGDVFSGEVLVDSFATLANECLRERGPLTVMERYQLPSWIKWDADKHEGDAYPCFSWSADVVEVSVDSQTFEVTVDKFTTAVDVGKAINPNLLLGNIEGGQLQALGWALMEDSPYKNGRPVCDRLQTYIIPTIKDTPEWHTMIVEEPFSYGPRGAKGVGELPVDGGAPAIANAIENALGVRITEIPITAEKLLRKQLSIASTDNNQLSIGC